jgi:hypothetical protein
MQQTWVIPFLFLSVMLGLYLFFPEQHRTRVQATIRRELNFLLIAELILITLAIPSTMWSRAFWLRLIAWLVFLVVIAVCVRRVLAPPPLEDEDRPL